MKTITKLSVLFLLLINFGCSNYYEELQNAGFTAPTLKNQPRMLYPKAAQENEISGKTEVILYVSKTGNVDNVKILKSSGYSVLDSASVAYSKSLLFNPATAHGEPVSARVKWSVLFKFSNDILNTEYYVQTMKQLYDAAENSTGQQRNRIIDKIFNLDTEFVNEMWDGQTFNSTIARVMLPEITSKWDTIWNSYPLSFLLYHDLIQRFPGYDSLEMVKNELRNSLNSDIQYIKQSFSGKTGNNNKEKLILTIKNFIEDKYPGIKIDEKVYSGFNS